MAIASDTYGAVFKNGAAILLARVVGADGQLVVPGDVALITYSVLELDERRPDETTVVEGHEAKVLLADEVFFAGLQSDSLWSADTTGYNFRHEIDVSAYEAFPAAGVSYQVRYEVTPTSGQKLVFRFHLRAI